ncbi:hypothetical protein BGZ92_009491 [Podila epicladia]|nr:hypothetical protein BGZ92_009491 [Podila epicladia]
MRIFSLDLHEFILKEQEDRTLVATYFRKSPQRRYRQEVDVGEDVDVKVGIDNDVRDRNSNHKGHNNGQSNQEFELHF